MLKIAGDPIVDHASDGLVSDFNFNITMAVGEVKSLSIPIRPCPYLYVLLVRFTG